MGVTRRTLAVDGNNILVRAVKATERMNLSSHGVPTASLMVFINCLSRYVKAVQPDRMVVCWDGGRSTFRTEIDPGYKASRIERSEDRTEVNPFAQAKEFLTLANIHHIEMPGVEADDLIAAYWRRKGNDDRVFILSGDKDFLQLLDGWTEQIRPGGSQATDESERWTSNRVRSEMKCKPEHIPLVMALTGDSGDGVPGVPGFGTKTAVKWLSQFDWDLDGFLASGVSKVAGWEDRARMNLRLVDLRTAQPGITVDEPPKFNPTNPTNVMFPHLLDFLHRYQLASIQVRLMGDSLWHYRKENS